jgi:hypothetical protein
MFPEPTGLEPVTDPSAAVPVPVPASSTNLESLLGALLAKLNAPAAPAGPVTGQPAPPPGPVAPKAPLEAGQIVSVESEGLRGKVHQVGVVHEVLEGDRVTVAWFAGLSGPLPAVDVTAL